MKKIFNSKRQFLNMLTICISVFFLLQMSGCKPKNENSIAPPIVPTLTIGLSLADLKEERWQRDRDYFVAQAESLGVKVIVQDAGGDPNAQLRQCDGLLAKGIKVLVVVPKNAEASRPIVLNAHQQHAKVISYDRLIADADVDLYLSFDNEKVGEIQAAAIVAKAPKGNYLVLRGDPADKNSDMIHTGHMKILQPLLDKGDIKIVADQACDKWLRSEARRITADALQKFSIDAVLASNDGTASGAISALEDKKLAGKIPVSGQDADLIACQYIWKGIQTVTVYKPIRLLAEYAAKAAVKMAKETAALSSSTANAMNAAGTTTSTSASTDSTIVTINNGASKVPAKFLIPIAVTKENIMETVVADGFHTRQEVVDSISVAK